MAESPSLSDFFSESRHPTIFALLAIPADNNHNNPMVKKNPACVGWIADLTEASAD
jgi:hypothetical protein